MKNVIEININNYEDAIQKFDNDKLSNELANFIYNECMALPINKKIEINIKTNCLLTENQENDLINMIHAYFGLEVKKDLIISKQQYKRQFILFILGIVLISISNIDFIHHLSIISEIYLIAGWVIIWELIYNIIFEDVKRKLKIKRYKKLSEAKVDFN